MRFVVVKLPVGHGLSKAGWYVRDTSVTGCVVLRGGHHLTRIDAQKSADAAEVTR